MHIRRTLAAAVAAIAMAFALCPVPALAASPQNAAAHVTNRALQALSTTLESGDVFPISISAPSYLKVASINVFKAKVDYDGNVFEVPTAGNFACVQPWTNLRYNPETGEFVVVSREDVSPGAKVATLSLKVKPGAVADAAEVKLTGVEASDGATDVKSEEPVNYVAKVVRPSSGPEPANPVKENLIRVPANPVNYLSEDASLAKTGDTTNVAMLAALAVLAVVVAAYSRMRSRHAVLLKQGARVGASDTGGASGASGPGGAAGPPGAPGTARLSLRSSSVGWDASLNAARIMFAVFVALSAIGAAMGLHAVGAAYADPDASRYDINKDGAVDDADILHLAGVVIGLVPQSTSCDINDDGVVTVTDLSLLARYRFSLVEKPSQPTTPEMPSTPVKPDEGGDADEPDTPGDPGGNEQPGATEPGEGEGGDTPDTPATPDTPDTPDTPATPDTPGTPDTPDTPDDPDTPEQPEFVQLTPADLPVTYQEIQMRNDAMKAQGIYGDHSQWPTGLEASDDGALMLVGTDCAGLYRSLDRGRTWEQADMGFNSRSTCFFAIDPNNSSHALVLGGSRGGDGQKFGGVYQSFDAGATWQQVENTIRVWGNRYPWDGFEFDPATFDPALGITTHVYLSTPYMRDVDARNDAGERDKTLAGYMKEQDVGLWRSTDGGTTYTQLSNDPRLADGIVKFTASGDMYVGNQYGLFQVDKDTGAIVSSYFVNADLEGFTVKKDWNGTDKNVLNFNMGVTGLDAVGDTLYVQTWDGIFANVEPEGEAAYAKGASVAPTSQDDFRKITDDATYKTLWPQFVAVSPADPDVMVMMAKRRLTFYYHNYLYCSHDGGKTWTQSVHDKETMFSAPDDWDSIERLAVFDPFDANVVTANGNGTITQSTDGGATFVQTNGISNLMSGGHICLNYYNPDIITLGAQDFAGVITTNGGDTWSQLHASKEGDQTRSLYGAYSPDGRTIVAWGRCKYTTPFTLMTSFDAGKTWTDTRLSSAIDVSHTMGVLQSYNDPNILFADNYRSTDGGHTWAPMEGCISAFTINYTGAHEIYGGSAEGYPVVSYDDGATWEVLYDGQLSKFWALYPGSERIQDLAYDHVDNVLYILDRFSTQYETGGKVNPGRLAVVRLPLDDPDARKDLDLKYYAGYNSIRSIAVDPNCTSVLYVAASGDACSSPTALYRSIDGGETFSNLTSTIFQLSDGTTLESRATNQGGYEANQVRVDPRTGRVYIGTNCYGFETINPPYDPSLIDNVLTRGK